MEKRDKNISYLRFVITYNIVLLIPLLIVSFSVFYMVHRQHYRKIMDETAVSAERQADYFKQQIAVICAYNADCRYSKIYSRQYSANPPGILSGNCGGFKKEGKHIPLRGQYVLLFPRRGTKSSFFGRNLYGGFVLFPYLPDGQKFIG